MRPQDWMGPQTSLKQTPIVTLAYAVLGREKLQSKAHG